MLQVRPHEVSNCEDDHRQNYGVEAMEPHLQARILVPLFAQPHADIRQRKAPGPRSDKRVDMELQAGHARDSCRECDKSADHRQQASDQYGEGASPLEEPVGDAELAMPEENVTRVAAKQRVT